MNGNSKYNIPIEILIPLIGMLLFLVFYFKAAMIYPGGSQFFPSEEGFSFQNNYLCDLLDSNTRSGAPNPSKSLARFALFLLCSCLTVLWYYIPKLFKKKGVPILIVRVAGISALGTTLFLSTAAHDLVIYISGFIGLLAMVITVMELFKAGYQELWEFFV
jgi:hypothetical protein